VKKDRLTQSIYVWARVFFLAAILPAGIYISAFQVYYYVESPELFSYQMLECNEVTSLNGIDFDLGCSEPINATNPYTGEFYMPRIVEEHEFEMLDKKTSAYQLLILFCFVIGGVYYAYKFLKGRGKL